MKRLPRFILGAALVLVAGAAAATEWTAKPSVRVRGEFNDNIRYQAGPVNDAYGAILIPDIRLRARNPNWELSGGARAELARYDGVIGLDTEDLFFDLGGRRTFERGSLRFNAGVALDTTLRTENFDPDVGLTLAQIDRRGYTASVGGDYFLAPRIFAGVDLAYSRSDYKDGERFGFFDYTFWAPQVSLNYQYSPRTVYSVFYQRSVYDVDSASQLKTTTDAVRIGARYDFSERTQGSLSAGVRRTNQSSTGFVAVPRPGFENLFPLVFDLSPVTQEDTNTGGVFDASLTRRFTAGSLRFNASLDIRPTAQGRVTNNFQLALVARRDFTSKLAGTLQLRALRTESLGGVRTNVDTNRYRIRPGLRYRWTRNWLFDLSYQYTRVDRDQGSGADSNAVLATISYRFDRLAVSR